MASYTFSQLAGQGTSGENLSGLKTFSFTNPSGSSYFTMETKTNADGFYTSTTPTNFSGSYNVPASMGLVSSSYVASVVVPPGNSSFTFTPANAVTGTTYYLRGTGAFGLTIS